MRNTALVRVLTIARLLGEGRHWTLVRLARRFNVHPRTIRRDIYALRDAGYIVSNVENPDGHMAPAVWWIER